MHIEDLRAFIQISTAGSVSGAARQWGIPKTSLSHRLRRLEEQIRTPLFLRHSGRLELTDAGATFLPLAKDVIRSADRVEDAMNRHKDDRKTKLRVGTTGDLSTRLVAPLSFDYMNANPNVELELIVLEHGGLFEPDIFLDLLIVSGSAPVDKAANFAAYTLTKTIGSLYAAPRYLERKGFPTRPQDLADHDLLEVKVGHRCQDWVITDGSSTFTIQPRSAVSTNDPWIVKLAAIHGLGIICASAEFVNEEIKVGALSRVLTDWTSDEKPLQILVPKHRKGSAQIRSLTRHFRSHFLGFFHYLYRISDIQE